MTTMLEKMAEAIEAKVRPAMPIYGWDAEEIARAALEAIRVPCEAMLDNAACYERGDALVRIWAAMIDAILNEKTP